MGLVVNLDEFSELCQVTAETMRTHVRAVEGEPAWLIERGTRGRDYKIDAEGGLAWWQAKRAADDQASAERKLQLQQLRLELLGPASEDEEALSLSGRQRREEIEAAMARIKLRRTMGELVEVASIEHGMAAAVIALRAQLSGLPGEFAIKAGLGLEDIKPLEEMLARTLDRFAADLRKVLEGGGDA